MTRFRWILGCFCLAAAFAAPNGLLAADAETTHKQDSIITIDGISKSMPINAFCLNSKAHLIVACGANKGEIREVNDAGEVLASWSVPVRPEAVNVGPNDTVLVGGEGKLFQYSATGELLLESDSPHAEALRSNTEGLRKQALANLKAARGSISARRRSYESFLKMMETKKKSEGLDEQEEQTMEIIKEQLKEMEGLEDPKEGKEPSEESIKAQVNSLLARKMRISSISTNGTSVFVATPSQEGYTYDVWRMDNEFKDASIIVTGLSGCCGQMDVQCCEDGLFVAENSRHRVVRFDTNGKELTKWGKTDRSGVDGFSGCCNPMNVCFGSKGSVFTAESGDGHIKQYNADGELIANVGNVELVPGCKNVSIAATPDNAKIYMLDLTRNHIVVMKALDSPTTESSPVLRQAKNNKGE